MSLEVTGRLIDVQPTQQIKENFSKREFVIETTSQNNTGMTYTNFAAFQLVNNACAAIDRFQIGQDIRVSFDIRGNKWEKDGTVRYITNLNAWRVEPAATMQQPQQGQAPQQFQQQYNQAAPPASQGNQFNNPAPGGNPAPFPPQDGSDLPF